ncbi:hypothetical protein COLINT_03483 [Collinsella intestinalis DSM 13280]|uniref:Uncharacterized protein n=1 Tax=Collinsella intestinalis DSM 13280 TaxID=521003 RepID=C4FBM1_9ACTN|nr:hypothetical protein COLINT_03483 [Collinsella intestinalis DSM 13280]
MNSWQKGLRPARSTTCGMTHEKQLCHLNLSDYDLGFMSAIVGTMEVVQ